MSELNIGKLYTLTIRDSQLVINDNRLKYIMKITDPNILLEDVDLFQKTIFIELKSNDYYYFMNVFTGLYLEFNNSLLSVTETLNNNCYFTWEKLDNDWVINKNSLLSVDDMLLKKREFLNMLRIFWSKKALQHIWRQQTIFGYHFIGDDFCYQDYCNLNYVKNNYDRILEQEKEKIRSDLIEKNGDLLITAGSQASGKSSIIKTLSGSYNKYYEVDSDNYIQMYDGVKQLNQLPIKFQNIQNVINSYTESNYFLTIFKDYNHKTLEFNLANYCITKNANFIKQGTSLWLNPIISQPNLVNYKIHILCIWIDKKTMKKRLSNRLLNTSSLRYYYSPENSIESYNNDWNMTSRQISDTHFNYILTNRFKITILCNDQSYCSSGDDVLLFEFNTPTYDRREKFIMNNYCILMVILLLLRVYNMSDLSYHFMYKLSNIYETHLLLKSVQLYSIEILRTTILFLKKSKKLLETLEERKSKSDLSIYIEKEIIKPISEINKLAAVIADNVVKEKTSIIELIDTLNISIYTLKIVNISIKKAWIKVVNSEMLKADKDQQVNELTQILDKLNILVNNLKKEAKKDRQRLTAEIDKYDISKILLHQNFNPQFWKTIQWKRWEPLHYRDNNILEFIESLLPVSLN
jgi:hypothetical protein